MPPITRQIYQMKLFPKAVANHAGAALYARSGEGVKMTSCAGFACRGYHNIMPGIWGVFQLDTATRYISLTVLFQSPICLKYNEIQVTVVSEPFSLNFILYLAIHKLHKLFVDLQLPRSPNFSGHQFVEAASLFEKRTDSDVLLVFYVATCHGENFENLMDRAKGMLQNGVFQTIRQGNLFFCCLYTIVLGKL